MALKLDVRKTDLLLDQHLDKDIAHELFLDTESTLLAMVPFNFSANIKHQYQQEDADKKKNNKLPTTVWDFRPLEKLDSRTRIHDLLTKPD